jgi:hypothetical protein
MGNSGGIILYIFKEDNLICYETNFREDEDIFSQVDELLKKYQVRKENTEIELQDKLFNYFYGGFGNYVFVNKNIELEIEEGYFIYKKDKIECQIRTSVRGVFLQFGLYHINLAYEKNITNIAIIGLRLWADGILIPEQTPSF